jgi:chromosome segregation ATPase
MYKYIVIIILLSFLSGCSSVSEEAKDKLLEKDPSFKHVLAERERIGEKIQAIKESLAKKKQDAQDHIDDLRKKYKNHKVDAVAEIKRLRRSLDPERHRIRENIKQAKRQIGTKKEAVKNLDRTIEDLEELLAKEGSVDISRGEVVRWRNRITSLGADKKKIAKEVRQLEEEIELLETKYRLLR